MKEKEIHLSTEEIDYLLKGTIHWEDILPRMEGPIRKSIDKGPKPQRNPWSEEESPKTVKAFQTTMTLEDNCAEDNCAEDNWDKKIRDWKSLADLESSADRQRQKTYSMEYQRSQVQGFGSEEPMNPNPKEDPIVSQDTGKNIFQGRTFREYDVSLDDDGGESEDFFPEDRPFWSGTKVYILLVLMGCMTLGTWAYFVFA